MITRREAQSRAQRIWNARPLALFSFPQQLTREQWAKVVKTGQGGDRRWAVEVESYYERPLTEKSGGAGWEPRRLVFAATLEDLVSKFEALARAQKGWDVP